jgi:hypothetical protein
MEPLHRYRAMEAFCRQRAKMEGEDARFWLAEAEIWNRRVGNLRSGPTHQTPTTPCPAREIRPTPPHPGDRAEDASVFFETSTISSGRIS